MKRRDATNQLRPLIKRRGPFSPPAYPFWRKLASGGSARDSTPAKLNLHGERVGEIGVLIQSARKIRAHRLQITEFPFGMSHRGPAAPYPDSADLPHLRVAFPFPVIVKLTPTPPAPFLFAQRWVYFEISLSLKII